MIKMKIVNSISEFFCWEYIIIELQLKLKQKQKQILKNTTINQTKIVIKKFKRKRKKKN